MQEYCNCQSSVWKIEGRKEIDMVCGFPEEVLHETFIVLLLVSCNIWGELKIEDYVDFRDIIRRLDRRFICGYLNKKGWKLELIYKVNIELENCHIITQ